MIIPQKLSLYFCTVMTHDLNYFLDVTGCTFSNLGLHVAFAINDTFSSGEDNPGLKRADTIDHKHKPTQTGRYFRQYLTAGTYSRLASYIIRTLGTLHLNIACICRRKISPSGVEHGEFLDSHVNVSR